MKNIVKKIPVLSAPAKILWRGINDCRGRLIEFYYHLRVKFRRESGVAANKRKLPLIVSLTSIPERLNKAHLCLESLLSQSLKPDYLILWLSEKIKRESLPDNLLKLEKWGLQIRFCRDIRSYKKIIHTLWKSPESIIATADDDAIYPKNWLEELYEAHRKDPESVHCHRAHLMTKDDRGKLKKYGDWEHLSQGIAGPSFLLFPTGVGGVLYPPGSLNQEVLNEKIFMKICPFNDDIWLKAMSLLNGVRCKKTAPFFKDFFTIRGSQKVSLYSQNVTAGKNDEQIEAVFKHYDLYDLLDDERKTGSPANDRAEKI